MSEHKDTEMRRLVRIESRLTNFGRHFGVDLTQRPAPNREDQPVFIDDGVVYCTPKTTMGELTVAVLRYKHWIPRHDDCNIPVMMSGRVIAHIDPINLRTPMENDHGED